MNYALAQGAGGRFLLRIEDIDIERCRLEFEQAIYEDLDWLGLSWETPCAANPSIFRNTRVPCQAFRTGPHLPLLLLARENPGRGRGQTDWPRTLMARRSIQASVRIFSQNNS